jgi:glycosyltransferase involved in cell wall biosynthesis
MGNKLGKKILYVGELNFGGTCSQRLQALQRLGYEVVAININKFLIKKPYQNIFLKIFNKIYFFINILNINRQIYKITNNFFFDILWIDKGLTIYPNLLKKIRNFNRANFIIGYSGDDMLKKHNQSKWWIKGLAYYDLYITTKSYHCSELPSFGIKCVKFVNNCYDPETHKPLRITVAEKKKFGCPVGFIGAWEKERAEDILFLAQAGITLRWWGGGWSGKKNFTHNSKNLKYENDPLWGLDYCKAINSFDINLCFLRKINRDLQTSRSVEIPACGGFMLAERTEEHKQLFKEGKEAEFFSSRDELIDKIKFYLANPSIRKKIAKAGRQRCERSGYSYDLMLSRIIKSI